MSVSMSTHLQRLDSEEDHETLFHPYPFSYYVQSPSTVSHANSDNIKTSHLDSSTFLSSPTRSDTIPLNKNPEVSRLTLSRYSSSHGSSNNSFVNDKKMISGDQNRLVIVDGHRGVLSELDGNEEEDEDEDEDYYGRKGIGGWWWRHCSFSRSDSCVWVCLQVSWRLMVSLGLALLVFYIATKPPPPMVSVKMGGVGQFWLAEGVDGHGVATEILTCNSSVHLVIENKSKYFVLHIKPPLLELSFGRLPIAMSRGHKLHAESRSRTLFKLYVGTRNKPMYGAGRNMLDMLDSGTGLPLLIRLSFSSSFRVVWSLIKPKFHHQVHCLLIIRKSYDKKHKTQSYNSTCTVL
ncbi:hypothetical protein K2173_011381 [Erythroxylum novogranatense]|uniref:Late embryogenesis abundant protein LEA-2 subgroup domain-containing protein n=1 Tax=Erythroxylum novogranatense TaxID=1862640 RepID=A0AAV8S9W1_9ROSI|nr:hypothetical protein K2173_011381 [Erythroxylum novogranatense]